MGKDEQGRILQGLNEHQREAVTHDDGPLLVIAGAGTGKTTTLARRVAWLIANGTAPHRILLLTFTRRAAAEMLQRVGEVLRGTRYGGGQTAGRAVWGGTFHAIATRLLRRYGRLAGLPETFTVLDRSDSADLLDACRAAVLKDEPLDMEPADAEGARSERKRFPQKAVLASIYGRCVSSGRPLREVIERHYPWVAEFRERIGQIFDEYTRRKEAAVSLDYDDLLVFWLQMLCHEICGARLREQFDHVLVDEYQDTNSLQAKLLAALRPDGRGLTVVGDDAQAIYSFRAATVENIRRFPREFSEARIVTLETNYRSTQPILDVANALIREAGDAFRKELRAARLPASEPARPVLVDCRDEDEQVAFVVERVLQLREEGVPLREQAVLFRAGWHSMQLELELTRRNIPFAKYGGLRFSETAHVKDVVAFLRLVENPRDEVAGRRVLQLLPGIGTRRAERLLEWLQEEGPAGADAPVFTRWRNASVPRATRPLWPEFVKLFERLAHDGNDALSLSAQLHAIRCFYEPLLRERHEDAAAREEDLRQLERLAERYTSRRQLIHELTLDAPTATQDWPDDPALDEDYLILSTIHSAKGLEWEAVFVLHVADGCIPSDMATGAEEEIEEERRLLYVAMTRARRSLHLLYPHRYYFRRGRDEYSLALPCRFLTPAVLERLDRCPAFREEEEGPLGTSRPHLNTQSIRAALGNLWAHDR